MPKFVNDWNWIDIVSLMYSIMIYTHKNFLYMFIEFTSHLKPEILVELYDNDIMGLLMVVNGPFLQDL